MFQNVRRNAAPSHLFNFLFLIDHSHPQGLNLRKENHHQAQVFIDSFLEGTLIRKSQSHVLGLILQILILEG